MKHLLITTIAAVLLVGCGESQQLSPSPETQTAEPVAKEPAQPSSPPLEAKPEPSTGKAPDISIHDAAKTGNIKAVKQHLAANADVNVKGIGGMTPLHRAAREGHKEVSELLITNSCLLYTSDAADE